MMGLGSYREGPKLREADLAALAGEGERAASGASWRAFVIGIVCVAFLSYITPYVEHYLHGTLLASNHLPVSSVFVLLFLVLFVNAALCLGRFPVWVRCLVIAGANVVMLGIYAFYIRSCGLRIISAVPFHLAGWLAMNSILFTLATSKGVREGLAVVANLSVLGMVVSATGLSLRGGASPEAFPLVVELVFYACVFVALNALFFLGPLSRAEMLVIFCMTLVSAAIPNLALMGYLIPVSTAPFYYADPGNAWAERIFQYIPQTGLIPRDLPGEGAKPIKWLYDGLPEGKSIPWGMWTWPIIAWSVLAFLTYALMFSICAILRKQWSDREKLPFPLAQVPIEMTRGMGGGRILSGFFRDRLMWLGLAIPFLIHGYNSLHDVFPNVPQIPLRFTDIDRSYLTDPPWSYLRPIRIFIYPSVIGLTYLVSLEVAFSLWLFWAIEKVAVLIAVMLGYGKSHWDFMQNQQGAQSFLVSQGFGAMLAMVLFGFWMARGHLKAIAVRMLRLREVDDANEPLGYFASGWMLVLSLLGIFIWMLVAGIKLWVTALILFIFVVSIIGLSRLVAEGGLYYVQNAWSTPNDLLESAVGTQAMGAQSVTMMGFVHGIFMMDMRSMIMPSVMHSFIIAGEGKVRKRHITLGIGLALAVAVVVSFVSFLSITYRVGGVRLERWFFIQYAPQPFSHASKAAKDDRRKAMNAARTLVREIGRTLEDKPDALPPESHARLEETKSEVEESLAELEAVASASSASVSIGEAVHKIKRDITGVARLRRSIDDVITAGESYARTGGDAEWKARERRKLRRAAYGLSRAAEGLRAPGYDATETAALLRMAEELASRSESSKGAPEKMPELRDIAERLLALVEELSGRRGLSPDEKAFEKLPREARSAFGRVRRVARKVAEAVPASGEVNAAEAVERARELKRAVIKFERSLALRQVMAARARLRGDEEELDDESVVYHETALRVFDRKTGLRRLRRAVNRARRAASRLWDSACFIATSPAKGELHGRKGEEIVFGCGDGTVMCTSLEGEVLWEHDTQGAVFSTPVLYDVNRDRQLDVLVGSSGARRLYCFDGGKGRTMWSASGADAVDSSAAVLEGGRPSVVFTDAGGEVHCVSAREGKRLWRESSGGDDVLVFAPGPPARLGAGRLARVSGADNRVLWEKEGLTDSREAGGKLWALRGERLVELAPQTGEELRTLAEGVLAFGPCGGLVVAETATGLSAHDPAGLKWELDLGGRARWAASGKSLIACGAGKLVCVRLADGQVAWEKEGVRVSCPPALAMKSSEVASRAVVAFEGGGLAGLRLEDGAEVWREELGADVFRIEVAGEELAVLTTDGEFVKLALLDGKELAREKIGVRAGGHLSAEVEELGRVCFVRIEEKGLCAVGLSDGRVRWTNPSAGDPLCILDMEPDGSLELVAGDAVLSARDGRPRGKLPFVPSGASALAVPKGPGSTPALIDVDSDGQDEVVVSSGGTVYAFESSPEARRRIIWRVPLSGGALSDPVAADAGLGVVGKEGVWWVSGKGRVEAFVSLEASARARPLPLDVDGDGTEELIVGVEGGVACVRRDGLSWKELRTGSLLAPVRAADVDGDGRAELLCPTEKGVFVLSKEGVLVASFDAPGGARSSPVAFEAYGAKCLAFGAEDGVLRCVDVKSKEEVWRVESAGRREPEWEWYRTDWVRLSWIGVGSAVMVAFMLLRQRFFWFPHPIGYVCWMSVHPMMKLWFSIFLGWFCKFCIIRYGGFKAYSRMRNFFIGLVVGEVAAGGVWVFVDFLAGIQGGWPIHIN